MLDVCSRLRFKFLTATVGVILISCSSAPKETSSSIAAPEAPKKDALWLSAAMDGNLSGLNFLSAEEKKKALDEAEESLSAPAQKSGGKKHGSRRERPRSFALPLLKWDVKKLDTASEGELRRALSAVGSHERVLAFSEKILNDPGCTLSTLAFTLAGKAEEYFPDAELHKRTVALYGRAAYCGSGELKSKAAYRSAMLSILQDDCKNALPHLNTLAADSENRDYHSRAVFWRWKCNSPLGNQEDASAAKTSLIKMYPLGYHSILAQWPTLNALDPWLNKQDTEIRVRSLSHPELNASIQEIEALLELGARRQASFRGQALSPSIQQAEPELQMYFGVLLSRADNYVAKFKLLSALVRDNPSMLSRAALKLLYPQRDLQALIANNANSLLILSLIRQESAFNSGARSSAGAVGLMQVLPRTARQIAGLRARELLDPSKNILAGTRYFAKLLNRFNGDTELALAAYNAGPGKVDEWTRRYPTDNRALFLDLIPFKETREYVASIARNYVLYSLLYDCCSQPESDEYKEQKTPGNVLKSLKLAKVTLTVGTTQ